MEDVVLHYRGGSAEGLGGLLLKAEQLLEPFACRAPPVFAPWFPAAGDRPPIRPAKAAPVIGVTPPLPKDGPAPEADARLAAGARAEADGGVSGPEPAGASARTPSRSWSVCGSRRASPQQSSPPTKRFQRAVSVHKLHLRQRAKWLISRHNCGATPDMEQVWRALSVCVRSSRLPTCNAHIRRESGQIWVFCDLLHAEQVGRLLKERLQLSGSIRLSVHRHGHVFSM